MLSNDQLVTIVGSRNEHAGACDLASEKGGCRRGFSSKNNHMSYHCCRIGPIDTLEVLHAVRDHVGQRYGK